MSQQTRMRRRIRYRLALACAMVALSFIGGASAQTPAFTYQGKLIDNGNPANGQYDFQFKLFDTPIVGTGAQLGGAVLVPAVQVTAGIFTVQLDFGVLVFPGAARYLEIAVKQTSGSTFITLGPRQPVTSNPYAIRSLGATAADALSVACVGCITSSQIQTVQGAQVTGNISGSQISGTIPAASVPPGSSNYVQNSTSQQATTNFNVSGDGTAGGTLSGNVVNATTQFNIGGSRVLSNGGQENLFAGALAGLGNTTGSGNSFFGYLAGQLNTTGVANSFFGRGAGRSNTTASGNSFFGNSAGFNNTTGSSNSFFGTNTGNQNTTGSSNAFFGLQTGLLNTTGSSNSFFGAFAASHNTTEHDNTFIGFNAGQNNGTNDTTNDANENTFVGSSAGLNNTTGSQNSFFGNIAGQNNSTGASNSFFGWGAGIGNTTGSNITVIGTGANVGANNLSFGTAIGSGAVVSASNTVVLGRGADTVKVPGSLSVTGALGANILDATTQYNLGGTGILRGPGTDNLFAGVGAGPSNPTGSGNSFFGLLAGSASIAASDNSFFGRLAGSVTTGDGNSFFGSMSGANGAGSGRNNTFIGLGADITITASPSSFNTLLGANAKIAPINSGSNLNFATAIGAGSAVQFSDMIVIGKAAGVYDGIARSADIVRTMGVFQPALSSPGGSPVCFNSGLSLCSSSLRYKTEIQPYSGGLDVAKRLNPITFAWKDGGRRDIGFAAEDVFKIEPLLTFKNDKGEIEGVQYAQISTVLVNSIKEQQSQLEMQSQQISLLQQQLLAQQRQITRLLEITKRRRSK